MMSVKLNPGKFLFEGRPIPKNQEQIVWKFLTNEHIFLAETVFELYHKQGRRSFTTSELHEFAKNRARVNGDGWIMPWLKDKIRVAHFITKLSKRNALTRMYDYKVKDQEYVVQTLNFWLAEIKPRVTKPDRRFIQSLGYRAFLETIYMFPETVTPTAIHHKMPEGTYTLLQVIQMCYNLSNPNQVGPTCLEAMYPDGTTDAAHRKYRIIDRTYRINMLSKDEWRSLKHTQMRKRGEEPDPTLFEKVAFNKTTYIDNIEMVSVPIDATFDDLKEAGLTLSIDSIGTAILTAHRKMFNDYQEVRALIGEIEEEHNEANLKHEQLEKEYNDLWQEYEKCEKDRELWAEKEKKYIHDNNRYKEKISELGKKLKRIRKKHNINGEDEGQVNLNQF